MKRLLKFDGDKAPRRFELIYQGAILGSGQFEKRQNGFEDVRAEASLMAKLHAISEEFEKDGQKRILPTGDPERRLAKTPSGIELMQPELDLLTRYVKATPWRITVAIDVTDAVDFLSAAPEVSDEAPGPRAVPAAN